MTDRFLFVWAVCLGWTTIEALFWLIGFNFNLQAVISVWAVTIFCAFAMPDHDTKET